MLSSFREVKGGVRRSLLIAGLASAVGLALADAASAAVDGYFIPEFEARAEHHSNIDLRPTVGNLDSEVDGYGASVAGTFGLRSPRGLTEVRPTINYQEYPDRDELSDVNSYLDLKSLYSFQRDKLKLIAHYSRENSVEGEIPEATFDNFDPNNPSQGAASGILLQDETITRIQVRPEWVHDINERLGFGFGGIYQTVNFDSDVLTGRKDNDYAQAEAFVVWRLDQRTDLRTGVYGSRFETDDKTSKTEAEGVSVTWQRAWTQTFTGYVSANVEQTDTDDRGSPTESSNSWGFSVGGFRATPISRTNVSIGRSQSPSFGGSRVDYDEIRVQYDRDLSERMVLSNAARLNRSRAQGRFTEDDNDFARADIELRYLISRTWYVAGGYSYVWQKFRIDDSDGNDNVFGIRFGYAGLSPQ